MITIPDTEEYRRRNRFVKKQMDYKKERLKTIRISNDDDEIMIAMMELGIRQTPKDGAWYE